MSTELSPAVIKWCEDEALGQCLTQWGKDEELPYDKVIELLEAEIFDVDLYEEHGIMVWAPYEEYAGSWIADQIESLYKSYIACAEFAVKYNNKPEEA